MVASSPPPLVPSQHPLQHPLEPERCEWDKFIQLGSLLPHARWKVCERPPNNPCQHMKVMTGHWGQNFVCVCVCVCPIGKGCLHLNWVYSLGFGGLVVFNVSIAGQNDLCGAGRHRSLNPPPCLFQFSPSLTVKRGLWLFSLFLSFLVYAPHIVKQASHWSRNVWKVFEFCELAFNTEETWGI